MAAAAVAGTHSVVADNSLSSSSSGSDEIKSTETDRTNGNGGDTAVNSTIMKVITALFYGITSFMITIVNKSVLTTYRFPSFQFLAMSQMLTTVAVLYALKKCGFIRFPDFSLEIFLNIFPLPFFYLGNMIFGLGSTQQLSLPMFTMLRRLSIVMTMVGEYFVLNIVPSYSVQLSVFLMILGAIIAAIQDLSFNAKGYAFVLFNNVLTTGNNLVTKQKLDSSNDIDKYGLLFYCAVFMLPLSLIFVWSTGDLRISTTYAHWRDLSFIIQYAASCVMGFALMYSITLCTQFNSALTTTIIGSLKNILITYLGMFIGGDYVYSLENFVGINISVIGSILYTWVTFRPVKKTENARYTSS